jgi:serine/threonine protein kinase
VVTEFFKKGSLLRKIRSKEWEYENKLSCMFHAACGVQFLHQRNIAHRNLKPENIYRWENIVKVGDLGVAKALDGTHMTSGVATYIHMAPEMYERDEYGLEADIWSLGIVFLEVALSQELLHIHRWKDSPSQEYDILEQQLHRLPGSLAKLVGKMIKLEKEERVKIDEVVSTMAKLTEVKLEEYYEMPL